MVWEGCEIVIIGKINLVVMIINSEKFNFWFVVLIMGFCKWWMKIIFVKVVEIKFISVNMVRIILVVFFYCRFLMGSFMYVVLFLLVFCVIVYLV